LHIGLYNGGEHGEPYSASIGNNLIPSITNFGSDVPIGGFASIKDHDPEGFWISEHICIALHHAAG
jgi:hypothetical protein